MVTDVYRLKCLTNLHMGSGDMNYNVVDLEVERDPVLGEPTMNATGVKGALRDACEEKKGADSPEINRVFGSAKGGQGVYRFFSGDLLARAVRVSDGEAAYALVTSRELIRNFLNKVNALGSGGLLPEIDLPEDNTTGSSDIKAVEGISLRKGNSKLLDALLDSPNWAVISSRQMESMDLPVQAHNVLDNGKSTNLWYEEFVPHQSVFGLLIQRPDRDPAIEALLEDPEPVVQFGAGATTGNGFVRMQRVGGADE